MEGGFDLPAALRELPSDLRGDAVDVGDATLNGFPRDAEAVGELGAEPVLIEVAGGGGLQVQGPAVQSGPASVRAVDEVHQHDVGVQLRVQAAAGGVLERG